VPSTTSDETTTTAIATMIAARFDTDRDGASTGRAAVSLRASGVDPTTTSVIEPTGSPALERGASYSRVICASSLSG
jgi:hypothetical protein